MIGRLRRPRLQMLALPALLATGIAATAGCANAGGGRTTTGTGPRIVAAENFWGSIAAQLGDDKVHVQSVITSPATDPHAYEPTAGDARELAGAQMVIVNGIGYDPWAPKLIAANPVSGRIVLDVGKLVGIDPGGNPHRWYSPTDVQRVINAIVADYDKLDSRDAAFFARQRRHFETSALSQDKRLIASIKQ